jgi:hypothetical protein
MSCVYCQKKSNNFGTIFTKSQIAGLLRKSLFFGTYATDSRLLQHNRYFCNRRGVMQQSRNLQNIYIPPSFAEAL